MAYLTIASQRLLSLFLKNLKISLGLSSVSWKFSFVKLFISGRIFISSKNALFVANLSQDLSDTYSPISSSSIILSISASVWIFSLALFRRRPIIPSFLLLLIKPIGNSSFVYLISKILYPSKSE